jgi:SAM-dependent methyltransferase
VAEADRAAWTPVNVGEATYQGLTYGSPLAYLLPLDRLAKAGCADLRGKKVLDFGHGGIGQLRLFAALGAEAVGVDVDPLQPVLYSEAADHGRFGDAGGSVRLVHGRFPADPKVIAAVGGGYDVFVSKNTLKNGYVHPAEPVGPGQRIDLGADDKTFLKAVAGALKPGGWLVIYNLSPAPAGAGQPYKPMADGRCPFAAADLAAAGFEVLARDESLGGCEPVADTPPDSLDVLALNDALDRLETAYPRRAELVKLRYFAGLTLPEVATILGVSQSTAEADWTYAKAWLKREMGGTGNSSGVPGRDGAPGRERAPMNESQVFLDALNHTNPAERAAFLDEACAGNPRLRGDVEGPSGMACVSRPTVVTHSRPLVETVFRYPVKLPHCHSPELGLRRPQAACFCGWPL